MPAAESSASQPSSRALLTTATAAAVAPMRLPTANIKPSTSSARESSSENGTICRIRAALDAGSSAWVESTSIPGTKATTRRPSAAARASASGPRDNALVIWPVGANVAHEAPCSPRRMNNVSATLLDPQATEQSARDTAAVALQYGAHDHLICTERARWRSTGSARSCRRCASTCPCRRHSGTCP